MSKENRSAREQGRAPAVLVTRPVRLPYGWACAVAAGGRLLAVEWEKTVDALRRATAARYPGAITVDAESDAAGRYLLAYAAGEPVAGTGDGAPAIAWERVGAFDRAILRETAAIPYGETAGYGEVAARAGRPGAARAAGAALSRNPWPVVVPCHRVIGSGGRLVGFGKGLAAKEALLRFEAAAAVRRAARRAQ